MTRNINDLRIIRNKKFYNTKYFNEFLGKPFQVNLEKIVSLNQFLLACTHKL